MLRRKRRRKKGRKKGFKHSPEVRRAIKKKMMGNKNAKKKNRGRR